MRPKIQRCARRELPRTEDALGRKPTTGRRHVVCSYANVRRVVAVALAVSLATGCTPAARRYVGGGIFFGGLASTLVAGAALEPCVQDVSPNAEPHHSCRPDSSLARPDIGRPMLIGGLLTAFFGIAIFATGFSERPSEQERSSPRPPRDPFPFDATAACALLTRRLDRPDLSTTDRLAGYHVAFCHGSLRVAATRAELSDVYLRDDVTLDEQRINVCYEHRSEWVLVSASAEGCGDGF